ncbi:MAG: hypothetical protein AB8E15_03970 [Bdellovibrionales bacterium]
MKLNSSAIFHVSVFVSMIFIGFDSNAQFQTGAIAASMGGAGRAFIDPVEAGSLNPAMIAEVKINHFGLLFNTGDNDSDQDETLWGITLVDAGLDKSTPGSFSYFKRSVRESDSTNTTGEQFMFSFGKYMRPGFAFGFSGKKLVTIVENSGSVEFVDYNLDLGFLLNLTQNMSFGLVFYDVFTGREGRQNQTIAFGSHYHARPFFRFVGDIVYLMENNADNKVEIQAGAQIIIRDSMHWAVGYRADGLSSRNFYTSGLGWKGPRLQFYYTFEANTETSAEKTHSLDMRVFF